MKRLISITVCIFALAASALAQNNSASVPAARESSPEVRRKTFLKVWETVRDKYFDPTFGGVDWQKIRAEYESKLTDVKSDSDLYALLERMLNMLHVTHLEIAEPAELTGLKRAPVVVGISLKQIGEQVVIWRIRPHSSAAESELRTGFVIKKIDAHAIETVQDARHFLAGEVHTKVGVTYLDENDQLKELTLERRLPPPGDLEKLDLGKGNAFYSLFNASRLSDGIGYLHFSTFLPNLRSKVRTAIQSMHDAPGIIIDLRGNGGGDDSVGIAMANQLFDRETQLMITRTRKGDDFYYKARPDKNPYMGPVAILLDGESASASEQFAAGMQETGRAVVIGDKTPGEDMDADQVYLPTGALFTYPYGQPRTPKGIVIDGRGVLPDVPVALTRGGLLRGDDEQLSAAIQYIKKQSANR
jgi:carboxyl-terminal processing protease